MRKTYYLFVVSLLLILGCKDQPKSAEVTKDVAPQVKVDPLPSWNEGAAKKAIIDYVSMVSDSASNNFVPESSRIATFDNDGTLWAEQPAYFQLFFAMDRIKAMAKDHPEWKNQQPFKAILEDDMATLSQQGMQGIVTMVMTSHANMTTDEFHDIVADWIKTAKHPSKNVGFNEMVYQPMLELLTYLRSNGFKTYIVSGGGVDFMRAIVTEVYGIPEEQIIGSRVKTEFDDNDGNPVIRRLPGLDYNDDKEGKPLNIQKIIGKKPVFAAGNSDGDLQMLQWTATNSYPNFELFIHHTDADREWAYDRESHIGQFDKGLDEATDKGWTLVDMKNDWKVVFPFELTN